MAISVTNEKDQTEQIDISTTADESIVRQQLKKYVSRQSDNENYKYVDISLPIPLLKVQVYFAHMILCIHLLFNQLSPPFHLNRTTIVP